MLKLGTSSPFDRLRAIRGISVTVSLLNHALLPSGIFF
jgi:hypothetical protein